MGVLPEQQRADQADVEQDRRGGVDPELAPEHRRHQRRLADEDADAVLAQRPQRRYTLLLQL